MFSTDYRFAAYSREYHGVGRPSNVINLNVDTKQNDDMDAVVFIVHTSCSLLLSNKQSLGDICCVINNARCSNAQ